MEIFDTFHIQDQGQSECPSNGLFKGLMGIVDQCLRELRRVEKKSSQLSARPPIIDSPTRKTP